MTRNDEHDFWPAVSPDGRRLAYLRGLDEAWIALLDGSGQRLAVGRDQLGQPPLPNRAAFRPLWSRAGRLAVAGSSSGGCGPEGCVATYTFVIVDPDAGEAPRAFPGGPPTWSRGGEEIAFDTDYQAVSDTLGLRAHAIAVMRVADSSVRRVYRGRVVGLPAWSPRRAEIAVEVRRGGRDSLVVVDARTTAVRVLGPGSRPAWSPDGNRLVFERRKGKASELFVVRRDGSGVRRLTRSAGEDTLPTWSPDGRRVAFVSVRSARWGRQLYVLDVARRRARRVTSEAPPCGLWEFWGQNLQWTPSGLLVYLASEYARGDHCRR